MTAARCYYAAHPATRPDCRLIAVVRYGPTPLCSSCDQRRSTLGKGQTPRRIHHPDAALDILAWVDQANTELTDAHHNLAAAVRRARQHGNSWTAIGQRLGISRQAAQQRFREDTGPTTPTAG